MKNTTDLFKTYKKVSNIFYIALYQIKYANKLAKSGIYASASLLLIILIGNFSNYFEESNILLLEIFHISLFIFLLSLCVCYWSAFNSINLDNQISIAKYSSWEQFKYLLWIDKIKENKDLYNLKNIEISLQAIELELVDAGGENTFKNGLIIFMLGSISTGGWKLFEKLAQKNLEFVLVILIGILLVVIIIHYAVNSEVRLIRQFRHALLRARYSFQTRLNESTQPAVSLMEEVG